MNIFEILGYIGSILVVISYCFQGRWLRYVSIFASVIMIIYAIGCELWPILITNSAIVLVNCWRLLKKSKYQQR